MRPCPRRFTNLVKLTTRTWGLRCLHSSIQECRTKDLRFARSLDSIPPKLATSNVLSGAAAAPPPPEPQPPPPTTPGACAEGVLCCNLLPSPCTEGALCTRIVVVVIIILVILVILINIIADIQYSKNMLISSIILTRIPRQRSKCAYKCHIRPLYALILKLFSVSSAEDP